MNSARHHVQRLFLIEIIDPDAKQSPLSNAISIRLANTPSLEQETLYFI